MPKDQMTKWPKPVLPHFSTLLRDAMPTEGDDPELAQGRRLDALRLLWTVYRDQLREKQVHPALAAIFEDVSREIWISNDPQSALKSIVGQAPPANLEARDLEVAVRVEHHIARGEQVSRAIQYAAEEMDMGVKNVETLYYELRSTPAFKLSLSS